MRSKHPWQRIRLLLLVLTVLAISYPLLISVLEGIRIDLGPLMSGRGVSYFGRFFQGTGGITPNFAVWLRLLQQEAFPRLVLNSTSIALISIGLAVSVGVPAAYSMARHKFAGKNLFTLLLLSLRTISPFAVIVPFYLLYTQLNLYDTYQGMSIIYLIINIPIVVLMMRGFFSDIPKEIYDAASTSGASEITILRRIALPLVLPGLIATIIFAFVATWNEYLYALILSGIRAKTVSRGVWAGFGESIEGFGILDFDELNAGGTMALIPAAILALMIKKYLARGFSLGTLK
ncbi:MAG: carbohydrate ABC transporter permease [Thaumarchaeota archaeon]|nr:carbohydrate ABC transporter permease [Nitrososphaerota archaeon]